MSHLTRTGPGLLRRWTASRILATAARLTLGGVMVWAGMAKLVDPRAFEMAIRRYEVLPEVLAGPWAATLPAIEVAAGACLLTGVWVPASALIVLLLLGSFVVALGVNVLRGVDMSCGCFGLGQTGGSLELALMLDVGLAALVVLLVRAEVRGGGARGRATGRGDGEVTWMDTQLLD